MHSRCLERERESEREFTTDLKICTLTASNLFTQLAYQSSTVAAASVDDTQILEDAFTEIRSLSDHVAYLGAKFIFTIFSRELLMKFKAERFDCYQPLDTACSSL